MDPLTTSALIGGAVSTGGGLFNFIGAKKRMERQFAHNKEMAKYAYNKDLDMWNRQNVYNSPMKQMERLEEAGLNPNLVYGEGTSGSTGQATEMPKYQAPKADYPWQGFNPLQMLGQFQDIKMRSAQADLISKQAEQQDIINGSLAERIKRTIEKIVADIGLTQQQEEKVNKEITKYNLELGLTQQGFSSKYKDWQWWRSPYLMDYNTQIEERDARRRLLEMEEKMYKAFGYMGKFAPFFQSLMGLAGRKK